MKSKIDLALDSGNLALARSLVYQWLDLFSSTISAGSHRKDFLQPDLWLCLANTVERTSDHYLIELLWQILEKYPISLPLPKSLPLLGIPIVNRPDLLAKLLDSIDYPVDRLAIVDNSITVDSSQPSQPDSEVTNFLNAFCQLGHPLIEKISVARPFRNLGVAASWNHILSSFPEASISLIANNDIVFAPGTIAASLALSDVSRPQFLPLLPVPNSFSAFLLTANCWDAIGLFDESFHPAYFEDLEFRDRIRANPTVETIVCSQIHASMAKLNPEHSATINSNPDFFQFNQISYALNKLWYLSPRRLRNDRRGTWRRLWLSQWSKTDDS